VEYESEGDKKVQLEDGSERRSRNMWLEIIM
jgi:hypothetical protein